MLGHGRVNATQSAAVAAIALVLSGCRGDAPAQRGSGAAGAGAASGVAERADERCDAPDASLVVDSLGIGPVLLGGRVAALARRCTVADTTLSLEGTQERAHTAAVRGHSVVVLSTGTPDTSIIRVMTSDPAFKTAGGVGVGSSVQALRLAHGRICAARGESAFVVMAADLPGVSFAIDWNPPPSRDPAAADTPFPGGDPGTALDAARMTGLWVHGVSGGCRVSVS